MTKIDIINKYIKNTNDRYNSPDIEPKEWYLENRKGYINSIHENFKNYELKEKQDSNEDLDSTYIKLFPHQKFIRDYLQPKSPYNGLLLYHGLGVGKTCASISSAELLLNNRNVTVMLPASLEKNYINEVMICGNKYYSKNQYWKFIEYTELMKLKDDLDINIIDNSFIDLKLLKPNKNNGLWYSKEGGNKKPNYDTLDQNEKDQIYNQLYNIIYKKYNVLHYNGINLNKINKLNSIAKTDNFFDNSLVIIDEVHNFISRVVNGSDIATKLYQLLFDSKNSKLLFLSGTPIINKPYEIVSLINILKKHITLHQLKLNDKLDNDKIIEIENILSDNEYIDTFSFDAKNNIYRIKFLPDNFKKKLLSNKIIYSKSNIVQNKKELLKSLNRFNVEFEKKQLNYTALPIKPDIFNKTFIDSEKLKVKNPDLFIKRILGTVSYFEYTDSELFPTIKENNIVTLDFSDTQFKKYYEVRLDEQFKEKKFSKEESENKDSDGSQVYKAFSRALCNFTFPDTLERPYPSKIKFLLDDVTYSIDNYDEKKQYDKIEKYDNKQNFSNSKNEKDYKADQYNKLINEILEKLVKDQQYYLVDNLKEYSPKFKNILDNSNKSAGSVLIYSQFRTVEGIGILKRVFNANGYSEFKLKKEGSKYKLDIPKDEYNKPKYAEFTGDKEANNILLNIFNNNFDNVPENIKKKLVKLHSNDKSKDNGNLRGSIIKIMMITQSGSEGISLKNVRQVHITEPYWNQIRIDQVIGRAVRTKSHMDLPKDERNISVFRYLSKFSEKQLAESKVQNMDDGLTTDQVIFNIAERKSKTNDDVLRLLKSASVDCHLHIKNNPDIKCFDYPIDINDNKLTVEADIEENEIDIISSQKEENIELELQIITIRQEKYMILLDKDKKNEGQLFDFDEYDNHENIKFVGLLYKNKDNKFVLKLKKPDEQSKKPDEQSKKPDEQSKKPDEQSKKPSKVIPVQTLEGEGTMEGPNKKITKMLEKYSKKNNEYKHVIIEHGGNPNCSYCTMASIINQMNKLKNKPRRYTFQDIRNIIAKKIENYNNANISILYQQEFGALPTQTERDKFNVKLGKMNSNEIKEEMIKKIKTNKWGTEFDFSIIRDKFKVGIILLNNESELYNIAQKINGFQYYTVVYYNGVHFQSIAMIQNDEYPYKYVFKCDELPYPIIELINEASKKSTDIEEFKC
jgi:hypothetical protein